MEWSSWLQFTNKWFVVNGVIVGQHGSGGVMDRESSEEGIVQPLPEGMRSELVAFIQQQVQTVFQIAIPHIVQQISERTGHNSIKRAHPQPGEQMILHGQALKDTIVKSLRVEIQRW